MRAEAALLALAHAAVYVVEGDGTPGLATLVVAVVGHFRLALALVAAAALAKRAMGGELWIAKVFTRGDLAVPDPDGGVAAACGADWEVAATCLGSGGRGGRGERRPATGRFPGGLVANLAVSPACTRAAAGGGARDRFDAVRTAPWLAKAAALRTSATARKGMSKKRTISSMVDANTAPHGVFEDRGTGQAGCSEDAERRTPCTCSSCSGPRHSGHRRNCRTALWSSQRRRQGCTPCLRGRIGSRGTCTPAPARKGGIRASIDGSNTHVEAMERSSRWRPRRGFQAWVPGAGLARGWRRAESRVRCPSKLLSLPRVPRWSHLAVVLKF